MLVEIPVLVEISLLDELQDVVVADIDVEVLVEHALYLVDTHQPSLLPVEQREHVQGLLLPPSTEKPLFGDEIDDFGESEVVLVVVGGGDFVLDLLAVHLGVGEVAQNAPEVLSVDVAGVVGVVEGEGVLDFVFLGEGWGTMSSESLVLRLEFLPVLALAMFFLAAFISYKIIVQTLQYSTVHCTLCLS